MALGGCVDDGVPVEEAVSCEVPKTLSEVVVAGVTSSTAVRSSVLEFALALVSAAGVANATGSCTAEASRGDGFLVWTEAAGFMAAGVKAVFFAWISGSAPFSCTCEGVPSSFGVPFLDTGGLASRRALGPGVGAGVDCEDDSCGAGVLDGRVAGEGRWELAAPGGGRRTAAFGLKADFLFSILTIQCPAAQWGACVSEGNTGSRAWPGMRRKKPVEDWRLDSVVLSDTDAGWLLEGWACPGWESGN